MGTPLKKPAFRWANHAIFDDLSARLQAEMYGIIANYNKSHGRDVMAGT